MMRVFVFLFCCGCFLFGATVFRASAQDQDLTGPTLALSPDGIGDLQPDLTAELGVDPEKFKGLAPEEILLLAVQEQMKRELKRLNELKPDIPSLFFSQQQYALLQSAMMGFDQNRGGGGPGNLLRDDLFNSLPDLDNPFVSLREVVLDGIVYRGDDDWIVWLNNQRLTPDRLPSQIKMIKVYKNHVDLKWFDVQSKKITPIRMRPNQRFNLDTNMFLPG